MKTTLITGTSSGLGNKLCHLYLERGDKVISINRTPSKISHANYYEYICDLGELKDLKNITELIKENHQNIDILINNAGINMYGPLELYDDDEIEKQITVNTTSQIILIKNILPVMKKNISSIIAIGSVGGFTSGPFNSIYHASKFALEGFYESIHQELIHIGIQVKIIELDSMKTKMLEKTKFYSDENIEKLYKENSKKLLNLCKEYFQYFANPLQVAKEIVDIIDNSKSFRIFLNKESEELFKEKSIVDEKEYLNRFII